jgi:hypothetical protein
MTAQYQQQPHTGLCSAARSARANGRRPRAPQARAPTGRLSAVGSPAPEASRVSRTPPQPLARPGGCQVPVPGLSHYQRPDAAGPALARGPVTRPRSR